jgi:antitoxin YefM
MLSRASYPLESAFSGDLREPEGTDVHDLRYTLGTQIPACRPVKIVTKILVMSETLPLSSVKAHLSELVDRVEDQHDRVVVTRNGKPAAVLVSPEDLESLEETLAILSDPMAMEQIRESERSLAAGEPTTSLAEIQAQLESRRRDATA